MSPPARWSHLVRHGLLGASLVAAAEPAAADVCAAAVDRSVTAVLGITLSPKVSFLGGVEYRQCVADEADVMVRFEFGGGSPRFIAGARVHPLGSVGQALEDLGVEAGVLADFQQRFAAHLGASYGVNVLYAAFQSAFPIGGPARPARTAIVGGIAPWSFETNTSVPGRPLSAGGRWLVPALASALPHVTSAEDRAVRDHFAAAARLEYSSVWTFLRLAAELAAVDAPAHLIAAALDAADDEVRHAELCAGAAGGVALAPLAMAAAQPRFTRRSPRALAQLAAEAWREGCLEEGAAAEEARVAAGEATDAARAAMLATIARDEHGHAELSWAVLAWLCEVAPEVTAGALAQVPAHEEGEPAAGDPALARHGVPSARITAHARAFAASAARARLRLLVA